MYIVNNMQSEVEASMDRPNIVFVMADQMSGMAMPFHGHPVVRAPALSRLAAEGVVFENAYCNSPLCGPSRTSMMTGQLPSKVGGFDNAHDFSAAIPTFAHYLGLAGYRTCLSGKMHFTGPDQLHGYGERLTTDVYPSDFGWTPNWADPDAKVRFQDMQNVMEAGPCLRSMQIDYDDEVNNRAVAWLYDRARDSSPTPFMLTVSFTSPHDPYVARPEFWDAYSDDEIDLPRVPALPAARRDPHSERIHQHYAIGEVEIDDSTIRRARRGYYASIDYVDSKLAALRAVLEETGLAENTILIFTSDHGDMMGERGLYYKKTFFEWAMRVPMIFWAPGRLAPRRVADTVSLLDLLPTFCDLAGVGDEVLETDGDTLLPLLHGAAMKDRFVAGEFLSEGVFDPVFLLIRGRHKLFYSEIDPPLLYDLDTDPDELVNLAMDASRAELCDSMLGAARSLWDGAALKERIIRDQNRRRLIARAHRTGAPPAWDFQPMTDAARQYVRAGKWTVEVEAEGHLDVR